MKTNKKKIDWATMLIPFGIVVAMMAVFMIAPEGSKSVVDTLRGFRGHNRDLLSYSSDRGGSVLYLCRSYAKIW